MRVRSGQITHLVFHRSSFSLLSHSLSFLSVLPFLASCITLVLLCRSKIWSLSIERKKERMKEPTYNRELESEREREGQTEREKWEKERERKILVGSKAGKCIGMSRARSMNTGLFLGTSHYFSLCFCLYIAVWLVFLTRRNSIGTGGERSKFWSIVNFSFSSAEFAQVNAISNWTSSHTHTHTHLYFN